ncbi:flagellar motor switch protein FliM [Vibrio harveyi]|nr:flagellar motor switch protein FliM [Vibrio harveyi]
MNKKSKVLPPQDCLNIKTFDLANPEHRKGVVQDIIDGVCKQFERSAKDMFQNTFRSNLSIQFLQQETIALNEHLQTLRNEALYCEFEVEPHHITGTLAIEKRLLCLLVDLYFGGNGLVNDKPDITNTELRLVKRFYEQILLQYSFAWQNVTSWKPHILSRNTLQRSPISTQSPLYQECRFSVTVSGYEGWIAIGLPFLGLEFLRDQHSLAVESPADLDSAVQYIIEKAPIRLMSTICERRLPLGDVMSLKEGDVIPIDLPSMVEVKAGQTALFTARVVESQSTLVLQIQNIIEQ